MRRPAILYGTSALLVTVHVAAGGVGLADHTSVLAGMPVSTSSWWIGPAYVVVHLLTVTMAPILAIAATLDLLFLLRRNLGVSLGGETS